MDDLLCDESLRDEYCEARDNILALTEDRKFVPGAWKLEMDSGVLFCSPNSKVHCTVKENGDTAKKHKGFSKDVNDIRVERYLAAVFKGKTTIGHNRGFIFCKKRQRMFSYEVAKKGITPLYLKRRLGDDMVQTSSIDL